MLANWENTTLFPSCLTRLPGFFTTHYEYHENRFQRLELPPIPEDRSKFDVHAALKPEQVVHNIYLNFFNYLNYLNIYYYIH